MPPLPAVASVLQIAFSGTISNAGPWLSRTYFHYSGTAPAAADLAAFDTAVDTSWNTNVKPLYGAVTELTQIETIDLTSSTGAVDVKPVARVGTRAGAAVPASACCVVSYEIARRYRGGHPRGYWPFGTDSDVAQPGLWSTSFQSAVNSGLAALFTSIVGAGWTGAGTISHVNVSYFKGFTVVTNPITGRARNVPTLRGTPVQDSVTAITSRLSIGTQRRRNAFID